MNVVYNYSNNAPPNRNLTFDCCGSNARSYLVFGQVFVNQKNTSFDSPYTFIGCEYDRESGYIRTGDRPYDPVLGIFPTCDKLMDNFPFQSPFVYSYNNPIMYSDRTGLAADKYFDETGKPLGDDKVGNNIRIIPQSQFNMLTNNGQEDLTNIENVLKQSSSLLSDYINGQDKGLQEDFQLKIYQHFNPTDLKLENNTSINNMAFSYGIKGKNLKILVNLQGNLNYVDNYDNVTNMFEHEKKHYIDYKLMGHDRFMNFDTFLKEQRAIKAQMEHDSWINTSDRFKMGVLKYLDANTYKHMPILPIKPINIIY